MRISHTDNGEAMKAPPPKPMIAMPVAMPGRSGNHLINVETGDCKQSEHASGPPPAGGVFKQ
jgi:hypothetical protein